MVVFLEVTRDSLVQGTPINRNGDEVRGEHHGHLSEGSSKGDRMAGEVDDIRVSRGWRRRRRRRTNECLSSRSTITRDERGG
jgi:hypothetical protein